MRQHGFTLIELMVVVGIIGILLSVVGLQFNAYSRKAGIEAQVKVMYSDLMETRAQALLRKTDRSAKFASRQFTIHATSDGSGGAIIDQTLKHGIVWGGGDVVAFDSRGLTNIGKSICVDSPGNSATVDSIVISQTRIQLGKRKEGKECLSDNIVVK